LKIKDLQVHPINWAYFVLPCNTRCSSLWKSVLNITGDST